MSWDDYQKAEEEKQRKEICKGIHGVFGMKEGDTLLIVQADGRKRHLKLSDLVEAVFKAIKEQM